MTADEAATIQAWSAVAQAVAATFALAVGVGVPIWQQRQAARVRLSVVPKLGWAAPGGLVTIETTLRLNELLRERGGPTLAMEVTNRSAFPVIVDDLGLCEGRSTSTVRNSLQFTITHPNKAALPLRVEPMNSTLFVFGPGFDGYSFSRRTHAYASVKAHGMFFGTSPAFSEYSVRRRMPSLARASDGRKRD